MNSGNRADTVRGAVLDLFRAHAGSHLPRWADHVTSRGDFEGRDFTIELFNVPVHDQRALRRRLRDVIRQAETLLDRPLLLVFHTPEATATHYASVAGGRIENASFDATVELSTRGDLSVPFATKVQPTIRIALRRVA